MTALSRAVLEYLADRYKTAYTVATIAEWIDASPPKVQAALAALREQGLVRYFEGHPGSWAVTPAGYRDVDAYAGEGTSERLRMALEAVVLVTRGATWEESKRAREIAEKALSR